MTFYAALSMAASAHRILSTGAKLKDGESTKIR